MPAPQVTVFGNLTREPELKYTTASKPWGFFSLANTEWKKNGDEWEEAGTSFYEVKMFGDAMERVAESFTKGDRLIVIGRLKQETWEKDGEKRSKMVVIADEVAASTKNATVTVTRITREYADSGSSSNITDGDPFVVPAGEWDPQIGYGSWPDRLLP